MKTLKIMKTTLYRSHPETVIDLVEQQFLPVHAKDVKPGQLIAYWETMFGCPVGSVLADRISEVIDDEMGGITVKHGGRTTEVDELTEVWVQFGHEAEEQTLAQREVTTLKTTVKMQLQAR